jgi:hypothetical protein
MSLFRPLWGEVPAMSQTALLESVSFSEGDPTSAAPEWLLAMLKQAMEEVMAGDATPLQKANAITRLGNLYLKAAGAGELAKTVKALTGRVAGLEEALAHASSPDSTPSAAAASESVMVPAALPNTLEVPPRPTSQPLPAGQRARGRQPSRPHARGRTAANHRAKQHR